MQHGNHLLNIGCIDTAISITIKLLDQFHHTAATEALQCFNTCSPSALLGDEQGMTEFLAHLVWKSRQIPLAAADEFDRLQHISIHIYSKIDIVKSEHHPNSFHQCFAISMRRAIQTFFFFEM